MSFAHICMEVIHSLRKWHVNWLNCNMGENWCEHKRVYGNQYLTVHKLFCAYRCICCIQQQPDPIHIWMACLSAQSAPTLQYPCCRCFLIVWFLTSFSHCSCVSLCNLCRQTGRQGTNRLTQITRPYRHISPLYIWLSSGERRYSGGWAGHLHTTGGPPEGLHWPLGLAQEWPAMLALLEWSWVRTMQAGCSRR